MASVKGIIVEIGGDTSKLQSALKKVNSSTSSLSKELKGINSLLKLDPKNTELVSQKQTVLKQNIEQTSEKLRELKKAQEAADETIKNGGKISEENYRNLQREIINTENKLKQLKVEASNWTTAGKSIEEFGNKISHISNKIDKIGSTLTTRLTLPIVGFATTAITSMDAVDEGLDTVAVKTGATGEAAKDLQRVYREVAAEVPGEFGDIGAAVGEINTRLDLTGDKLKTASVEFLKFAKVNGVDVNTSVQLVTRAMGDAGIKAEDYASLLDMLTVAGQKSGVSMESLTTNLAKYGAPMRALGIDTKNAIAMFAGWEKAGVNTEIAFSGMKKAISNWGAAGKDSTKEFSKTLNEIAKCPTIAKATTKAIQVFGAKAGPDLADAIKGGRFEFEEYVKALENGSGTLQSTYSQIVDEVDDTQLAMQNAKLAMHDAGEIMAKTLGPILLDLSKKFKGLMERFDKLSDKEKKQILNMGLMVASIGPAIKIFFTFGKGVGKVTSGIGVFSQALAVAKNNATSTNATVNALASKIGFLATPTGLATTAIVALCAAYTAFHYQTVKEKAALGGLTEKVKEQKEAWENLQETRNNNLSNSLTEIKSTQQLADELRKITDENGKVKQGYEERAKTILGILNEALGTEYSMTGNVINKYQELKDNIDNVIATKKAEAVLNAYQEEYGQALKGETQATETLVGLRKKLAEAAEQMASGNAKEAKEAELLYSHTAQQIGEQTKLISSYGKTITDIENLQKASVSNNAEEIDKAITQIGISYDRANQKATDSIESQTQSQAEYMKNIQEALKEAQNVNDTYQESILNSQLETERKRLATLTESLAKQTSTIKELTPEQSQAWKSIADASYIEYSNGLYRLPEETRKRIEEATGIIAIDTSLSTATGNTATMSALEFQKNLKLADISEEQIKEAKNKVNTNTEIETVFKTKGEEANKKFTENINLEKGKTAVSDYMKGANNGGNESKKSFWDLLFGIGRKGNQRMRDGLGDGSPSVLAKEALTDYFLGADIGAKKGAKRTLENINDYGSDIHKQFVKSMNAPAIQDFGKLQGKLSNQIIDSTKTVFTTPQIVFNVQELDEAKLQQCFNYINRKFGSAY